MHADHLGRGGENSIDDFFPLGIVIVGCSGLGLPFELPLLFLSERQQGPQPRRP